MIDHEKLTHTMQAYQGREEPERLYVSAGIYWRMLLLAAILIFVVAIAGGAYLLISILFGFNDVQQQQTPAHSLNRGQLTSTMQAYAARKDLFDKLDSSGNIFPDPTR